MSAQPISVPLERVRPLLDQGASAGISPSRLLEETAISDSMERAPEDGAVSLADYYRIQNLLAILIGDETCHLSQRQLIPGSTDFVLRHVGDCTSLQQAMRVIAESYNMLHGGAYNRVEVSGSFVDYIIDDNEFPYTFEPGSDIVFFSMESTLIFLHCMLVTISPQIATEAVTALSLKRPKRDDRCSHLSYWQLPVKYNQSVYRMRFDADLATRQMPKPAATQLSARAVYDTIQMSVARLEPHHSKAARDQVEECFRQGLHEQHEIAREMRMSVATLRRRLSEEGTSFRDLREQVLNRQAKMLLLQGLSVMEVSEQLGFAEFRSFVRAFKNWNGVTPAVFISNNRDSSAEN
ncbi:helix-turn-helix transcriptional regulator [Parvularcula sp. IMCC14364]|uniref:helix-turn-helix transcriptional regulator n=1 Tax=Parvularcula sp. IMCC14364 TaxID=3067902 RepID=UPI00274261B1|nr:helix-turn-helix transcriptional regulator [Parvularcula sp. IMCC14364]